MYKDCGLLRPYIQKQVEMIKETVQTQNIEQCYSA